MIHRLLIPIIVGTLLPYLWLYLKVFHGLLGWRKYLFWLPSFGVIAYSAYLSFLPNFVPANPVLVDIWFGIMALFAVPQFVFCICDFMGKGLTKFFHFHIHRGKWISLTLAVTSFFVFIYGFTFGFRKMEVRHITITVPDLPKSFDGYRIVQFSDIHLGSYYGWRKNIPQRDICAINAQHADMICFTGDIQNVEPSELVPYKKLLSSLKAKDGVFSVLGNHDYSFYVDGTDSEKKEVEKKVQDYEKSLGWNLLNNEHSIVRRGKDSIVIAGTENYDSPKHTKVAKALYGIKPGSFVLMLQHIPTQWKEMMPSNINKFYGSKDTILMAPQLTLSGHTHAGQVEVLGLRPTMFAAYDYGLYEREGCQLYTTSGLGGVVPIRVGATAEIVVITLKKK